MEVYSAVALAASFVQMTICEVAVSSLGQVKLNQNSLRKAVRRPAS